MKRDWDLIRDQLLAIEQDEDFMKSPILGGSPDAPKWADDQAEAEYVTALTEHRKTQERVFGHLEMLVDNGYIDGLKIRRGSGGFGCTLMHPRLTMAGHDLLDTMRSEPLWDKIKSTAKTKSIELTFDTIKGLAGFALKSLLGG
ncbi:Hypothetical protein SAMN05518800_1849 [Variovorax sp. YR752]|uniref:DUF2513 domain-containing protein n=1 Tax=Variovorax sp. YR752 TaxID=1884383 RepID=UPI000BC3C3C2|nr:DUF2513 domain-containing protein [Variovorax sp. YR752]SOD25319.1 Hypothetical protein SAMN05518800_1849 [Variovorax sp. YR752]